MIGLLKCERQKVCPVIFTKAFYDLFPRCIREIIPKDLENVSSGVPGQYRMCRHTNRAQK